VVRMEAKRYAYRSLFGKAGEKSSCKTWRKWEEDIGKGLKDTDWKGVDWVNVAEYKDRWRAVNCLLSDRVSWC
jgi:hypothetical protein